jgi:hypothetical protein
VNPFDEITNNDMPNEDLRWIADDCGLAIASLLLSHFGKGITLYIPKFVPGDWSKVTLENLPNDDMRLVGETCGVETAKKLMEKFPQSIIYVPRIETTPWARAYIRKHYDGSNAKRLAAALGVSDRYIYKCMHDLVSNRRPVVKDGFEYIDGCRQEKLPLGARQ